jgi:hypothetical protein
VLTDHEQKIWNDIERHYRAEGGPAASDRTRAEMPPVVIGGGWSAVLLALFGVPMAGLAVGAAAALIWLLWRFFPQLDAAPDDAAHPDRPADLLRS